jgi:NAD-dependent SIR2 family protein deacetylase
VIGTSSVVYPAAGFAMHVKSSGGSVVEVNIERGPQSADLSVIGKAGETLPTLFGVEEEVQQMMQETSA